MIYRAVCTNKRAMNRKEICEAIGRSKSPHILDMIEHLVDGGYLVKSVSETFNKREQYVYSIGHQVGACKDLGN